MTEITTMDELDATIEESRSRPIFVFKHSTTCPVSARASTRVAQFLAGDSEDDTPEFRMLKVIEARPASNALAERTGVVHQSPQLILLHNGESVWDASHHNINGKTINAAIADHC